MRLFVTGATGFVGSAVVSELLSARHEVLGLARSDASAAALAARGVAVHRGSVEDLDRLRAGALACDGVIHTAFVHDFAKFVESCEIDRRAIAAIGDALAGSPRPFLVTSGTGLLARGRLAVESDRHPGGPRTFPRVATEDAADAAVARGARVAVVRLPPTVHGDGDHGFVPALIGIARRRGVSAYVGDGANRWPAVHRLDAARLYRLAIEREVVAGTRYHAVAEEEEGVPFRGIAEVIARRLGVPLVATSAAQAEAHFEWFAHFAQLDTPASSAWTQERLGWRPTHAGLLDDLDRPGYFAGAADTIVT
jgi:nucleoside-diphosphate-sugar epimerase